jgi:hypothetical protein
MPCSTKEEIINKVSAIFVKDLSIANKRDKLGLTHKDVLKQAKTAAVNHVERRNAEAIVKDLENEDINLFKETSYVEALPVANRTRKQGQKDVIESLAIERIETISPGVAKLVYYTEKLHKREVIHIDTLTHNTIGGKTSWSPHTLKAAQAKLKQQAELRKASIKRMENNESTLFSQAAKEEVKLSEAHVELKNKIWKDPNEARNFFKTLHSIDGGENTKYIQKMETLLSDITDSGSKILNEFKVYVDKTAKENAGMVKITKNGSELILNINENSDTLNGDMTAVEAYMHELVHLSVEFAKQYKKGPIFEAMNELITLHEQAKKEITVEQLVVDGNKKRAQDTWNSMFNNGTNGVSEFIAIGMTNERMIDLLNGIRPKGRKEHIRGDGIWNTMVHYLLKIYEAVRELVEDTHGLVGDERLRYLAGRLWEHNSNTVDKHKFTEQIAGVVNKTFDVANKVIKTTVLGTSSFVMAGVNKTEQVFGEGHVTNTLKFVTGAASLFNPWMDKRQIAARNVTMTKLSKMMDGKDDWLGLGGILAPESTIMTYLNRTLHDDDILTTEVEKHVLLNKQIDAKRYKTITTVGSRVLSSFGGKLSHREQNALTEVLIETDVQSLTESYDIKEIGMMLHSNKRIADAIKSETDSLRELIKDKKHLNYALSQTKGLANYMVTGTSGSTVEKTARDIFYLNSVDTLLVKDLKMTPRANHNEAIAIIDRLASLEALQRTDKNQKILVSTLLDKSLEGIETVLMVHKMYDVKTRQFELDNKLKMGSAKGEIKDTRQAGVEIEVAADTEVAHNNMKKLGYKKVGEANVPGYNVYTKMTANIASFDKQAVAKINVHKKLHNIEGVMKRSSEKSKDKKKDKAYVDAHILDLRDRSGLEVKRQMENVVEPEADGYTHMIAYVAESDEFTVTNYGVSISKELSRAKFNRDDKAPILLGRMTAEIDEKNMAKWLNEKVYKIIEKDSKNYLNRGEGYQHNDYIEIGPDAKTEGLTERSFSDSLLEGMPDDIRRKIMQKKKGNRYIAVRRDLARMYFGSRDPSILNMKIPMTRGQTIKDQLKKVGMDAVTQKVFDHVGVVMSEIGSMQKVDIVIKTPIVAYQNTQSNFNYSVALGQTPLSVAQGQMSMFKATKHYLDNEKELLDIELAMQVKMLSKNKEGNEKLKERRKLLKIRLKENPVAPLMDAGLFTAIAEDINNKDLHTDSRVTQFIDNNGFTSFVADNTPQIIKDGVNNLFITEDTSLFKTLVMFTTFSDFVARANRYNFLVGEKGYSSEEALKMILDEHVHYGLADTPLIQWLSKFFYLRFFKYFIGANKSLIHKVKEDPARMLLMAGMLDGPNPSDASILEKDFGYMLEGPFDTLIDGSQANIFPPSLLEAFGLIK